MVIAKVNYKKLFGSRVRAQRAIIGLTQSHLAEDCGLFRTYLSRIETGVANPSLLVMVALADGLHVQLCDLLSLRPIVVAKTRAKPVLCE
ncbi:MAG: helix-turn-helix domain-containing protein [Rhodoferax sp.]